MGGDLNSDHATLKRCIHRGHAARAVVRRAHRTILACAMSSSDWIATIEAEGFVAAGLAGKGLNA